MQNNLNKWIQTTQQKLHCRTKINHKKNSLRLKTVKSSKPFIKSTKKATIKTKRNEKKNKKNFTYKSLISVLLSFEIISFVGPFKARFTCKFISSDLFFSIDGTVLLLSFSLFVLLKS